MFLQKFTNKEIKPEFIEVHGINIPGKNEVKLLGITIDDKLMFDKKVDIFYVKMQPGNYIYCIDLRAYLI